MDDRAFWLEIRRGLLAIVRAIETRYPSGRADERQAPTSAPREAIRTR